MKREFKGEMEGGGGGFWQSGAPGDDENDNWEARRFGRGGGAQLGLLKDAVGLVENHGKVNPTDTELLPNFMCVAQTSTNIWSCLSVDSN